MVPTFTCGLSRSNFSFATFVYLLEVSFVRNASGANPQKVSALCRHGLPGPVLDHALGDVRRDLSVGVELHRVGGTSLGRAPQVGRGAQHLRQRGTMCA